MDVETLETEIPIKVALPTTSAAMKGVVLLIKRYFKYVFMYLLHYSHLSFSLAL